MPDRFITLPLDAASVITKSCNQTNKLRLRAGDKAAGEAQVVLEIPKVSRNFKASKA